MGDADHWERQQREIESYNIFYSAFHGIDGGPTLKTLGFRNPYRFPQIPIRNRNKPAEPDVAIFNGEVLLLVEIKSGKNCNKSHLEQMEHCDSVTIEDGINWLKNAQVTRYGMDHNDLENIEPAIVYDKSRYEEEIEPYADDRLDDIASYSPILSQSKGGKLSIERGSFGENALDSFFADGVPLPEVPPPTIYLTEGLERESLAVSICLDHVIRELKHGRVELSPTDVEDIYPRRAVELDDIVHVLDFLDEVGACRFDNEKYVFEQGHQRNFLDVKRIVSEERVDDYMDFSSDQEPTLDDF